MNLVMALTMIVLSFALTTLLAPRLPGEPHMIDRISWAWHDPRFLLLMLYGVYVVTILLHGWVGFAVVVGLIAWTRATR